MPMILDSLRGLLADGGALPWLVVGSFLFPGLAIVALEWTKGSVVELRSYVWAAVFLPACVALAVYAWQLGLLAAADGQREAHAVLTLKLGALLSTGLLIVGLPAMRRARRGRKPVSPPPSA